MLPWFWIRPFLLTPRHPSRRHQTAAPQVPNPLTMLTGLLTYRFGVGVFMLLFSDMSKGCEDFEQSMSTCRYNKTPEQQTKFIEGKNKPRDIF